MLHRCLAPLIFLTLSLPAYAQSSVTLVGEHAGEIQSVITGMADDPLGAWCQTSMHRPPYDFDPARAQATLPLVVENTFAPDGTAPEYQLTAFVMLPPSLVPRCPDGAVEPVWVTGALPDGRLFGTLQPTNISSNGHVFFAEIAFTASDIHDWELRVPATEDTPFTIFGAYRLHAQPDYDGPHSDALAPDILPTDWTTFP
jgi:hypothetical protein